MNKDELFNLLISYEWKDVEFKEARIKVPKTAYETVSAFANTEGGHLVFGIRKQGSDFEIVGVLDVDKVQNDFISSLKPPKVSKTIDVREHLHQEGGTDLLIFYIPESPRADKPIFLNGDIRRSFIRRGGCDICCTPEELKRFINDGAAERFDGQAVDFDLSTCFDTGSLKWYRRMYEGRPGNKSYAELDDSDFLFELGLLIERSGSRLPTRAAILLFGRSGPFRQLLPRPVVDCQRFSMASDEEAIGRRWLDRLVIEENLVNGWRILLDWYQKLSDHPFRVDPVTLQREDEPPDYIAFRESAINLLIHQDYADHARKPAIKHYLDRTVFWNPGDAFAAQADLLEPGEKEVRNPRIVTAFRRIGLSEHAGWGLREVFRNWQQLGNIPPHICNDKARKTFELTLLKEKLLSEEQLLFQADLGVHLGEAEARAFAYACRKREITLIEIKAVTNLSGSGARQVAEHLCTQVLLKPVKEGERYVLADHLRDRFLPPAGADLSTAQVRGNRGDLSTAQVEPLKSLTKTQWKIIALCEAPRRLAEIMDELGVSSRGYFKTHHLGPLLKGGVIRMTNPDNPRAANQKYVLTEMGLRLKISRQEDRSS
jgi:ATP-dependent DNA helicase RecG